MQFLKTLELTSVVQILNSDSPSFALIRQQPNGQHISKAILSKLIIDFVNFLNIGKTMNESQVIATVKLILEDYSVLKPDDFVLFFNRAKKGCYGKVYDRMDGSIIIEWLELFLQERNDEIEAIRINEHKKKQKDLDSTIPVVPMPEWFKEWLSAWKIKESFIDKPKLNQSEEQAYYSQCLKEFHDLWVLQGSTQGAKYVKINGKFLDSYEYLQWRIENDQTS